MCFYYFTKKLNSLVSGILCDVMEDYSNLQRSEGSAVETARGVSLPWPLIRARAVIFNCLARKPVISVQQCQGWALRPQAPWITILRALWGRNCRIYCISNKWLMCATTPSSIGSAWSPVGDGCSQCRLIILLLWNIINISAQAWFLYCPLCVNVTAKCWESQWAASSHGGTRRAKSQGEA